MSLQKATINGVDCVVDSGATDTPLYDMSQNGGDIIARAAAVLALRQSPIVVDTVADIDDIPAHILFDGCLIQTKRYSSSHTVGDGSGNLYVYHASGSGSITEDGGFYIIAGPASTDYVEAVDKSANVLQFGAVGDNTADDTTAIDAAITAAGVRGTVLFPYTSSGYKITTSIAPLNGQKWTGENATIQASSISDSAIIIGDGAGGIDNVYLSGISVGGTCNIGIEVDNAQYCIIDNCHVKADSGTKKIGFFISNWWGGQISNCTTVGTNNNNITDCCFHFKTSNGGVARNLYTSNFCDVNFYIENGLGGSFQGLTAQGGDNGIWMDDCRSIDISGVYEENVAHPLVFGTKSDTVSLSSVSSANDTFTVSDSSDLRNYMTVRVALSSGSTLPSTSPAMAAGTDYFVTELNRSTHTFKLKDTRGGEVLDVTGESFDPTNIVTQDKLVMGCQVHSPTIGSPAGTNGDYAGRLACVQWHYANNCAVTGGDYGGAGGVANVSISGTGSNAQAVAVINSSGEINHVSVIRRGSGYSGTPTATVTSGGGSGATLSVTLDGDEVDTIAVTDPGSGYTSAKMLILWYRECNKCLLEAGYCNIGGTYGGLANPLWPLVGRHTAAKNTSSFRITGDQHPYGGASLNWETYGVAYGMVGRWRDDAGTDHADDIVIPVYP